MKRKPLEFPIGGLDDGVVRIRLRADSDLPAIVEASRDPAIRNYTRVRDDYGLEDAREGAVWAASEAAKGRELSLALADAADDSPLGSIGLFDYHHNDGRLELGYWLAPWARGRGTMTRGVRLFCQWIFDELEVTRIAAGIEPDNAPSHALIQRVGFQREGTLRSLYELEGRRRDVISYSLLRGEL